MCTAGQIDVVDGAPMGARDDTTSNRRSAKTTRQSYMVQEMPSASRVANNCSSIEINRATAQLEVDRLTLV